jgi:SAM-dependent methyltransferase
MSTFSNKNWDLKAQYGSSSNHDARRYLHERYSKDSDAWLKRFFDVLDLPERASILEVGGGTGYIWQGRIVPVPPGWDVTLTDMSQGMVATASERLAGSSHTFAFAVADIQALPFADASFDCVIANHMLYHVPDLDKGLSEAARVLRPGGRFYAATNGLQHMVDLHDLVAGIAPEWDYGNAAVVAAFSLEDGGAALERHFADVRRHDFIDALEVTDVEPVANYVMSVPDAPVHMTPDRVQRLRDTVARAITARGAFTIRRASGIFSARRM